MHASLWKIFSSWWFTWRASTMVWLRICWTLQVDAINIHEHKFFAAMASGKKSKQEILIFFRNTCECISCYKLVLLYFVGADNCLTAYKRMQSSHRLANAKYQQQKHIFRWRWTNAKAICYRQFLRNAQNYEQNTA